MSATVRIEGPVLHPGLYTPAAIAQVLDGLPLERRVECEATPGGMRLWLLVDDVAEGERVLKEILNQVLEVSLECLLVKQ